MKPRRSELAPTTGARDEKGQSNNGLAAPWLLVSAYSAEAARNCLDQ